MDYIKLKEKAKKSMEGKYQPLVLSMVTFMIMWIVCNMAAYLLDYKWVAFALMIIGSSLIVLGFVNMVNKVAHNKKIKFNDLFDKTENFMKIIAITLIVTILISIFVLLAMISFRSLVMVMANFPDINTALATFLIIFGLLLIVGIIAVIMFFIISFSMTLFVLNDNEKLSATEALAESFDMMDGFVLDYLTFVLTFIGWFILGLFTFGILYLWIVPYFMVSKANFYKIVKKDYEQYLKEEKEKLFNNKDVEEN